MATQQVTAPARATCSRCEGIRDTEGYPLWCKVCRAKHRREYEATKKEMSESRGYAAGCTAMREAIASGFLRFPNAHFSGAEVWAMVMKAPGPNESV